MSGPSRIQRDMNEYLVQRGMFEELRESYWPSLTRPIPTSYKASRSEYPVDGRSSTSQAFPCVLGRAPRAIENQSHARREYAPTFAGYSSPPPGLTTRSPLPPVQSASYARQRSAYQYSHHEYSAQATPPATRVPILATSTNDIDEVFACLTIAPFSPPKWQTPKPFASPGPADRSPSLDQLDQRAEPVSLQASPPASNDSTPLSTPSDSSCGDEVVYKVTTAPHSSEVTPTARDFPQTYTPIMKPESSEICQPSAPASAFAAPVMSGAAAWDLKHDKSFAPSAVSTSADWSYALSAPATAASRLSNATSPDTSTMDGLASWANRDPDPPEVHWL